MIYGHMHRDARFEITGMVVPSVENFSDDNPHFWSSNRVKNIFLKPSSNENVDTLMWSLQVSL